MRSAAEIDQRPAPVHGGGVGVDLTFKVLVLKGTKLVLIIFNLGMFQQESQEKSSLPL